MLKVGYDAQAFLSPNGGTGKGVQLRNLVGPFLDTFTGFASNEPNSSGLPLIREGIAGHNLWQNFSLPGSLRRHRIEVFLAPYNVAPLLLPKRVQLVLVLHDTILMQGYRKADKRGRWMDAYKRWLIPRSVARAKIVLTVSEHARSEILRVFPRADVRVIPCSIAQRWFHSRRLDERSGYLLMVTSGAPHKNATGGLRGYAEYVRRAGVNARPLKIVGLGADARPYRDLASQLDVSHLVSFLPYLSEEKLIASYQDAGALLFPSFAEGFGIPLLEAMATGTPAIVARAASLPEVGAGAACYFDPFDTSSIADALERVLSDQALRESMARRGLQRSLVYHPETVAKQVRAFWEEVAGVHVPARSSHESNLPSATGAIAELENVGTV